eukprot:6614574-Lingulodinium_polyedra.AAC.1
MVSIARQFEPFAEANALKNARDVKHVALRAHGKTVELLTRSDPLKLKAQNPFGVEISVRGASSTEL